MRACALRRTIHEPIHLWPQLTPVGMLAGMFISAWASGPPLHPIAANKALAVARNIYREDEGVTKDGWRWYRLWPGKHPGPDYMRGRRGCDTTSQREEASQERRQRSLSCSYLSLSSSFGSHFESEDHSAGLVRRSSHPARLARILYGISRRRCSPSPPGPSPVVKAAMGHCNLARPSMDYSHSRRLTGTQCACRVLMIFTVRGHGFAHQRYVVREPVGWHTWCCSHIKIRLMYDHTETST